MILLMMGIMIVGSSCSQQELLVLSRIGKKFGTEKSEEKPPNPKCWLEKRQA